MQVQTKPYSCTENRWKIIKEEHCTNLYFVVFKNGQYQKTVLHYHNQHIAWHYSLVTNFIGKELLRLELMVQHLLTCDKASIR